MEERKPDYQRRAAFEFVWAIMGHYEVDFPRLISAAVFDGQNGLDEEIKKQCDFYLPTALVKALLHTLTMLYIGETRKWVREKSTIAGKQ